MAAFFSNWGVMYFWLGACVSLAPEVGLGQHWRQSSPNAYIFADPAWARLAACDTHALHVAATPLLQVEGSRSRCCFRIVGIAVGSLLAFTAGLSGSALNNPYYITAMVALLVAVFSLAYPVAEMRCGCCGVMPRGCWLRQMTLFSLHLVTCIRCDRSSVACHRAGMWLGWRCT